MKLNKGGNMNMMDKMKVELKGALEKARQGKSLTWHERDLLICYGKARSVYFNDSLTWVQVSPMKVVVYQYDIKTAMYSCKYKFRGKIWHASEKEEKEAHDKYYGVYNDTFKRLGITIEEWLYS